MVSIGLERFLSSRTDLVAGERVGLVTNPSGVNRELDPTIDLLADRSDVNLVRLFGPEHGIRGRAMAGEEVDDHIDEQTGLPVTSLYGETRQPSAGDLANIDVLIYDMQDIGVRYYTLIYTLANIIEASGSTDTRVVVFDRPNPIAPLARAGNRVPEKHSSFVGDYQLPVIHRLTVGELAQYFNGAFEMNADIDVVELDGWSRDKWYDETNLPWVPPSPNMPTLDTATLYPGTCLFEGTTLSEGRGTARPFKLIGAPWIDAYDWAANLNEMELDGVIFRPAFFTPQYSKHQGEQVEGVEVHLDDRNRVNPVTVGLSMLISAFNQYPESEWRTHDDQFFIDRLAGGPRLRQRINEIETDETETVVNELQANWQEELDKFESTVSSFTLY